MPKRNGGIIAGLFIGLILAIAGFCVAFLIGKPILQDGKSSMSWPKAVATITRSEILKKRVEGDTKFRPDITYKFDVEDQQFDGDTVRFGTNMWMNRSSGARKVTARYNVGQKIDVFYQPDDPLNNVIEPGTTPSSYLVYGTGLLFLILGVLAISTSLFKIVLGGLIIGRALTAKSTELDD